MLIYAKHCSKHFTNIYLCNFHHTYSQEIDTSINHIFVHENIEAQRV